MRTSLLALALLGARAFAAYGATPPAAGLPLIHGGKVVSPRDAATASTVKIEFLRNGRIRGLCAAAILDRRTLLTAAHCFDDDTWDSLRIVRGDTQELVSKAPVTVKIHPDYRSVMETILETTTPWAQGDIAVVQLPESELLRGGSRALPGEKAPRTKQLVKLYGYSDVGLSTFPILSEDKARAMRTLRVSENEIISTVRGFALGYTVAPAGGKVRGLEDSGVDIFMIEGFDRSASAVEWIDGVPVKGDSGGPALDANGELIGIYSKWCHWTADNGEKRYFAIYVDVTAPRHRRFIEQHLQR